MTVRIVALDDEGYLLAKIRIALIVLGISSESVRVDTLSSEEIAAVDSNAKSIVLVTAEGNILKVNDILRYLVTLECATNSSLGGKADEKTAIDKWLDLSWTEFG